jgi:hypothetical protein
MSGRRLGLFASLALVVAANAVVLAGAAWNRSAVDARLGLTERECWLQSHRDSEDSGMSLRLIWRQPNQELDAAPPWLDREALRSLGFDVSLPPTDPNASKVYSHVLPRDALIVLEMDGPAWRHWLEERKSDIERMSTEAGHETLESWKEGLDKEQRTGSRLVAVAAGLDAGALRTRYPDRSRDLILPAEIRLSLRQPGNSPPILSGFAELRNNLVHVPLSLRPVLVAIEREPFDPNGSKSPRYRVTLAAGKRQEPWLETVERISP